ncbi:hypothetical protein ACFXPN_25835 [Streptomyces griseorubiginosus]|uniref:hypothetical protein n=1 Tax=Streptomyces griseorubiginosus TaxID=67304 RepID=UPI0036C74476
MPDTGAPDDVPLFWSQEGHTAEIVRCHQGHLAARETFETVGGCPYCNHTPGERVAALQATRQASKTHPSGETATVDERHVEVVKKGTELVRRASAVQFTLGDLALEVVRLHESHCHEPRPLAEVAEAMGISAASLARYRRVAAAWPQGKRDARTSWTVHAILSGHPDRFDLIKHPPPGPERIWTCAAAQNVMKRSSA